MLDWSRDAGFESDGGDGSDAGEVLSRAAKRRKKAAAVAESDAAGEPAFASTQPCKRYTILPGEKRLSDWVQIIAEEEAAAAAAAAVADTQDD